MTRTPIIAVAITGGRPKKKDDPAVPVTPGEQVESTHQAFEAGASLVHIRVRDDSENPCSDIDRFACVQEGVRKHCPGMVIQFSTGGRGRQGKERGLPLELPPDMGSLATASVNFANNICENPPDLLVTNRWWLERGGNLRTGLEDNIYRSKGVLAASNAELVTLATDMCREFGARLAAATDARPILGLRDG